MSIVSSVLTEIAEERAQRVQASLATEPGAVWVTTGADDLLVYCKTSRHQLQISQENFRQEMSGQPLSELVSYLRDAEPLSATN